MTAARAAMTETMSEKQLMDSIIDHARQLGYLVYHDGDSRRNEPGYPDLTIAGHGVVVFIECKTERGRLRGPSVARSGRILPGQADWLDALAGAENDMAAVVRPSDLDDMLAYLKETAEKKP